MFERFTPESIKVIMLAQEESRRLGHNFVGIESILLGLLGENKGFGGKALRQAGLNLKDTRAAVERLIGRGHGFVAVEIPFTPGAKRVLEASWNYARSQHASYIATEHLLVGVISQDAREVAIRAIGNLNVSQDRVRTELEKVMKLPPGSTEFTDTTEAAEPSANSHCQWCGEEVNHEAKLCRSCQRPQGASAKRCQSCAEVIWAEATICRYCNKAQA